LGAGSSSFGYKFLVIPDLLKRRDQSPLYVLSSVVATKIAASPATSGKEITSKPQIVPQAPNRDTKKPSWEDHSMSSMIKQV